MFTRDGVTVRPLELEDIDALYLWHLDWEMDILSSWGPKRSMAEFRKVWEARITEPDVEILRFGIEVDDMLVGSIALQQIDRENGVASIGFGIGNRDYRGKGIGTKAITLILDYAFTVENLDRVYAEAYDFNQRSQRVLERVGFVREGIHRKHELHNGARRDMYYYGILKEEFYARYETMFRIPRV